MNGCEREHRRLLLSSRIIITAHFDPVSGNTDASDIAFLASGFGIKLLRIP